jgi:gliding motility-associated-like protein
LKTDLNNTNNALKEAFDGFEIKPSTDLWDKINKKNIDAGNVKSTSLYSSIYIISAVAIIAIATFYYFYKPNVNSSPNIIKEQSLKNIHDSSSVAQFVPNNEGEEIIISDSSSVEEVENINNEVDKKKEDAKENILPVVRKDCGDGSDKAEVAIVEEKKELKQIIKPPSPSVELSNKKVISNVESNKIEKPISTDTFKVVFGDNQVVCFGEDAILFVEEGFSYRWNTGDVQNKIIVSPVERSVYTVTVTNSKGFTSIHDFVVDVDNSCSALFIPSAFTPNFDGQNDVFKAEGRGIKDMHMVVYNKQGQTVFESNNIDQAWDGNYKGSMLADIYLYQVTYKDAKGVSHIKRGQVTLIR